MEINEDVFVKRRIYLSLEKSRDLCLRNLLRKIWLLDGGPGNTRVKVQIFATGVRFSMVNTADIPAWQSRLVAKGDESPIQWFMPDESIMENDEVECLIAGLIYKVCLHQDRMVRVCQDRSKGGANGDDSS